MENQNYDKLIHNYEISWYMTKLNDDVLCHTYKIQSQNYGINQIYDMLSDNNCEISWDVTNRNYDIIIIIQYKVKIMTY